MIKLTILATLFLITVCSKEGTRTLENPVSYKIEYTSQLLDANLNLDVTFEWNDFNGQAKRE